MAAVIGLAAPVPRVKAQSCRVTESDRTIVGVGIAIERLGLISGQDRVNTEELPDRRIVLARPDMGEAC
ncbi:hypothetical protein B0E37_01967 [Streptomyces sp. MH192]|nr:hypothetical protein [Streptomyces sp. MH192]MCF0099306.1 hypothetical protein [Streptomyces sp. MH191]